MFEKLINKIQQFFIFKRKYTITYSVCNKYYYINGIDNAHSWLSVDTISEQNIEDAKSKITKSWMTQVLEVKTNDNRRYARLVKNFNYWSIKSGKTSKISGSDDMVLDYLVLHKK